MADIAKTGVWIDTSTGKVTTTQPAEGIQLVAPGGEIDANAQRLIDDANATVEDTRASAPTETTAKKANRKRR